MPSVCQAWNTIHQWAGQRPRPHLHHVPADSSWLDETEALLTSVPWPGHGDTPDREASQSALRDAVRAWGSTWTPTTSPFVWLRSTYGSTAEEDEQHGGAVLTAHDATRDAAHIERTAGDMSDPAVRPVLEALLAAPLPSGERVREAPLATRLGVSRHSVRKALRVLAEEGMLDRRPDRGVAVPHVDSTTVLDLYAVRAALGSVLMQRAALLNASQLRSVRTALADVRTVARRNDRSRIGDADLHFQDMVARAANLPQTSLFFQRLTLRLRMFIGVLGLGFADTAADLIAGENARIFEAIRAGDGTEAARLWRVKVERSVRFMATQLPDSTFDPNLWATIAGKPERRADDPRKARSV